MLFHSFYVVFLVLLLSIAHAERSLSDVGNAAHAAAAVKRGSLESRNIGLEIPGLDLDIDVDLCLDKCWWPSSRQVFAHYMVGTTYREHAIRDIDDAIKIGLTGFALNVAVPDAQWSKDAVQYLFEHAEKTYFSLYINMDIAASGDETGPRPDKFNVILQNYTSSPAYLKAKNGAPFVATYAGGQGYSTPKWKFWKDNVFGNFTTPQTKDKQIYFCPNFERSDNYYNNTDLWWKQWDGVADCLVAWDSTWQARPGFEGSAGPGSIELDQIAIDGSFPRGKGYGIGLSPLQYKNAYGSNVFRSGGLALINRMMNILTMAPKPDFTQVLTWNDGPESSYFGNNWPEQNTDIDPAKYVTPEPATNTSHKGWQPLIRSFSEAYINGIQPSEMNTFRHESAVGSFWYKRVLQGSSCNITERPSNWEAEPDEVIWAIILRQDLDVENWKVKIVSGGKKTIVGDLKRGLNFGTAPAYAGSQHLELQHRGVTQLVAQGGTCISLDCPGGIYNMNPVVRALKQEVVIDNYSCTCPDGKEVVKGRCVTPFPDIVPDHKLDIFLNVFGSNPLFRFAAGVDGGILKRGISTVAKKSRRVIFRA